MTHSRPFPPARRGGAELTPIQICPAPPPIRLLDEDAMRGALEALRAADPAHMPAIIERVGLPPLRRRAAGFAGLAKIVTAQQVSTASAAAIFRRLEAALIPFDAVTVRAAPDERLRICGLSSAKIRTLRAVATAMCEGTLALPELADLPASEAQARLVAIPGIGPWTAAIFLLFCLGHADTWPAATLRCRKPRA